MKIKNILLTILFIFLEGFQLSCWAETAPDIQKIIARGKLIVAVCNQDYPPFFFHNSKHELEGFDIELAKEIAYFLGVKLEFNTSANSFNDVIQVVENESADLGLSALSATIPRGLHVSFSTPYLKENKALIINRILDLKLSTSESTAKADQLKFAVIKNSSYETFIKDKFYAINKYASPNRIITYNTIEDAMKDLMAGNIYALFTDEIRANYLLKNFRSANIYSKKELIEGQIDPISIAVNWRNQNLLNWINLLIKNIQYDGIENRISQKYLNGFK